MLKIKSQKLKTISYEGNYGKYTHIYNNLHTNLKSKDYNTINKVRTANLKAIKV